MTRLGGSGGLLGLYRFNQRGGTHWADSCALFFNVELFVTARTKGGQLTPPRRRCTVTGSPGKDEHPTYCSRLVLNLGQSYGGLVSESRNTFIPRVGKWIIK